MLSCWLIMQWKSICCSHLNTALGNCRPVCWRFCTQCAKALGVMLTMLRAMLVRAVTELTEGASWSQQNARQQQHPACSQLPATDRGQVAEPMLPSCSHVSPRACSQRLCGESGRTTEYTASSLRVVRPASAWRDVGDQPATCRMYKCNGSH